MAQLRDIKPWVPCLSIIMNAVCVASHAAALILLSSLCPKTSNIFISLIHLTGDNALCRIMLNVSWWGCRYEIDVVCQWVP